VERRGGNLSFAKRKKKAPGIRRGVPVKQCHEQSREGKRWGRKKEGEDIHYCRQIEGFPGTPVDLGPKERSL